VGASGAASFAATGTFKAGVVYQLDFTLISNATTNFTLTFQYPGTVTASVKAIDPSVTGITTSGSRTLEINNVPTNKAVGVTLTYAPDADTTFTAGTTFLNISSSASSSIAYVGLAGAVGYSFPTTGLQDVTTRIIASTLAEKRGLRRTYFLSVPGIQTTELLKTIGDAWLYDRLRAQFKGSITLTGPAALRQHSTGDVVHPSRMLLNAGEIIRLQDRVDPDTGSLGRDARVQSITYDHAAQSATLELDNRRDSLQTFLNRLAAQ
jgi:hypothetical protein